MDNKFLLSAEELFFIGTVLKGRYIDYSYVSAIETFEESYSVASNEIKTGLIKKGIITEDFGGDIAVDDKYVDLLVPVFDGRKEVEIDDCVLSDSTRVDSYKFHFSDEKATCVHALDDCFEISSVSSDEIIGIIQRIASGYSSCQESKPEIQTGDMDADGLVALKVFEAEKDSIVKNYFVFDQTLYQDKDNDYLEPVSAEQFAEDAISLLRR